MQIVHINVRLSEGGAAKVALDLHRRLQSNGIGSVFFYGYGTGANKSYLESSTQDAMSVASKSQVILNYLTHSIAGIECFSLKAKIKSELLENVEKSDVVHLHAVHSYFLPLPLLSEILERGKRIIWTCHDYWPITGRCAFTEVCTRWKQGCGGCVTKVNYPPSIIDISKLIFKRKRSLLAKYRRKITFVAPSLFVRDIYRNALPDHNIITIHNGIDSDIEMIASKTQMSSSVCQNKGLNIVVMANDLNDDTKINQSLVNSILKNDNLTLHTIGRNSPFLADNVINHGVIIDRKELFVTLKCMDALVFSSIKDTFGLVMIESMICGTPVLATHSEASNEVLGMVGHKTYSEDEIVVMLRDASVAKGLLEKLRHTLSQDIIQTFSGETMFKSYVSLYAG